MLRFILRKMLNKKWMVLALLIGNLLLVGITSTNPMYMRAVLQRMLMTEFQDFLVENNQYPMTITATATPSFDRKENLFVIRDMVDNAIDQIGLPVAQRINVYAVSAAQANPRLVRGDDERKATSMSAMSDLENHITIVSGRMYSKQPTEDGIIEVIVSEMCYNAQNLLLDDVMDMPSVSDPNGNPLVVRLVGVFKNSASDDNYWVRTPTYYRDSFFMDYDLFGEYFLNREELDRPISGAWFALMDYTALTGDDVDRVANVTAEQVELISNTRDAFMRVNYADLLSEYQKVSSKVTVTMWVLQVPIFVLLAVFIFMVSRQMLEMEESEIAVIKSRGANQRQILTLYFIQSVILAALGFVGGVFLGSYLCQVLGSSNSFMEFVQRSALDVQIKPDVLLYAAAASVLSVLAMVLPVLRYSKVSIVNHKQKKHRRGSDRPMWQKLYLDVVVLGVSLYGLYSFNGQKDFLAKKVMDGASLDPLLFLCSSLFMIGAGLVALRILPALVWLIFTAFKKWWSPALYASFQRILRTRKSQSFIMVFLIMTIALGVFNSEAARTINTNEEENIRYNTGADIVLQERWVNLSGDESTNPTSPSFTTKSGPTVYYEPPFERYEQLEGAASVAKVYVNDDITVNAGSGNQRDVRLMAIDTKAFGETINFKSSLNEVHINYYLNAISQNVNAVLLSSNFATNYKVKLGDSIRYQGSGNPSLWGIVCGFVDYFPSYAPTSYALGSDGVYTEMENYLVVAHLSQVQAEWGVLPYQIWIKSKDDSTQFIYDFIEEKEPPLTRFRDTAEEIVTLKNDPVFQGTNGVLTVGFIVVLLLCAVGFLIYWVLSIQSRALQFGIFRAMGMSMREILTMLLNEHLYISGLSIAMGFVVGKLTARLYMPLIQLAYATADSAVPLQVVSDPTDLVRIGVIVGIMLVICLSVLGILISRMKIAQALKLGED